MEKHETAFIKHGFDTIDFIGEDIINDADLATMGINDPQDKHDLMEALKRKGYSQGNNKTQGVLASKFPISILTRTHGQHRCQKIRKIPKKLCTSLRFCQQAAEFEKT